DMRAQRSLYLIVLKRGTPSPLARESDEEKIAEAAAEKKEMKAGKPKEDKEKDKDKKPQAEAVVIDFDGISQRILALPVPPGNYASLSAGTAGQIYYLDKPASPPREISAAVSTLQRFDLTKRKAEPVMPGLLSYVLSADHKKALVASPAPSTEAPTDPFAGPALAWSIIDVNSPIPGKGKLNTEALSVKIEPRAEWRQIFDEAWRINRDYFYDPAMHGADW